MVARNPSDALYADEHARSKPKIFPWFTKVGITDRQREMLEQLQEELGHVSEPEVFRRGLELLFKEHRGICRDQTRAISLPHGTNHSGG